ncbi:MAG: ribosome maturation factor [Deltaproteobacteria bacterium]|jgi:ribosome maturation factor RimP|nr:ribosome maturation factor [Deltaproteobacteria bacterium]
MEEQGVVREITRIAEPLVRSLGLAIWGVEVIPAGRTVVRIYVDAPAPEAGGKGPGVDQCAKVSRHVGLALEAEDLIPRAYALEVSSPGLERPFFALSQLAPYVGNEVTVKLADVQPELPDRKRLRGKLMDVGEHAFVLLACDAPEGTRLSIRWDNVRKATLAPELPFSKLEKPGKKKSAPKAGATSK